MTAVPYDHGLVGSQWPAYKIQVCAGCCEGVVEMAAGCWVATTDQSAQCPAGGWHKP